MHYFLVWLCLTGSVYFIIFGLLTLEPLKMPYKPGEKVRIRQRFFEREGYPSVYIKEISDG